MSIWSEAFGHCRNKSKLKALLLNDINLQKYKNKTFEEIFTDISTLCETRTGLGSLTIYDITATICRYYKINIDKVYIIGNGPKNAVKILGLKTKKHNTLSLNYVEIDDIIQAFAKNSYSIDSEILLSKNGDDFESYICKWQKPFNDIFYVPLNTV